VISRLTGRLFRILVAAGLTAYVLLRSDPRAVLDALASADLTYVAAAVLLVLADRALMAWRWIALLCIVEGNRPPIGRLIEIFFVSTFLGTFLPASIGGDAVRAYSLSRDRVSGADAVASVFMDRMLGVASLLLVSIPGLLLARDLAATDAVLLALAVTALVCAFVVAVIFSERIGRACARAIGLLPLPRLERAGRALVDSVQGYAHFHGRLLVVLIASIAVQILRIVQAYYLGLAIGIGVDMSVYFAFVPLILLVMLLPVTVNGIGTSQAAFVWFFARAGVAGAPAFALSVLFVGLGIVGNLPGAMLYAVRGLPATGRRLLNPR
jgi:uncharacterized protein (TIRG00374 family)